MARLDPFSVSVRFAGLCELRVSVSLAAFFAILMRVSADETPCPYIMQKTENKQ